MSDNSSQDQARERLKESLSVTLDGQASDLELRRILDGVGYDDELRATASRYQLIGDAIRGETNQFAGVDLSSSIMGAIEREDQAQETWQKPAAQQQEPPQGKTSVIGMLDDWWGSLGRVAMAASVAFAVIIGVRTLQPESEDVTVAYNDPGLTISQPIQLSGQNNYGATGIRAGYSSRQHGSVTPEQLAYAQSVADQAMKERFRAYALQHAEMSALNGGQGVLPFARLTSFDTQ